MFFHKIINTQHIFCGFLQSYAFTAHCSVPEIACMICLVMMSRSSSDSCSRLSVRAGLASGSGCCLPLRTLTFSLLLSSFLECPAEEAAAATSSTANSEKATRALPDIPEKKEIKVDFLQSGSS